ncbi:MAG: site-specific integrase [Oscillospiraceae bacterium]|nr:site-specific integrase [Oscillospiraceae bacterium]
MRRANGTGTVVKLSGRRRCPYEARTAATIDEWGYPRYDVVGRFATRTDALQALALYNNDPYSIADRTLTFSQVYDRWFASKYGGDKQRFAKATICTTQNAYKWASALHNRVFSELRTTDLQNALDNIELGYNSLRQVRTLLTQMYKYALEYELASKNYAQFVTIKQPDDTESGVPFTKEEIALLWANVDTPSEHQAIITALLILIYSGWRITEFTTMPVADIDLTEWTMTGGIKTAAGKNRVVPIHSGIQYLVQRMCGATHGDYLLTAAGGKPINTSVFRKAMQPALKHCGITSVHTPHDCRHTFVSLLDSAGANQVCIQRLAGHASKGVTQKVYTHKDLDELREAVELIQIAR